MNDSIPPIRYVPQISQMNHKGRADDKKGDQEQKRNFLKHLSSRDKGSEGNSHDQLKAAGNNDEQERQENECHARDSKDHDFDGKCGTFLDTEI